MNGRERLAVLADALEVNAANPTGMKFDLGGWIEGVSEPDQATINCGTVGCAVGLACLLPELQAEGLSLYRSSWGSIAPAYDGARQWPAVWSFFDLNVYNAYHLFDADSYIKDGPTQGAEAELRVAKRIREYLVG